MLRFPIVPLVDLIAPVLSTLKLLPTLIDALFVPIDASSIPLSVPGFPA